MSLTLKKKSKITEEVREREGDMMLVLFLLIKHEQSETENCA